MNTYSLKQKDIKKKWYLIDANGLVLGRLASKISMILRGKHKTNFTPHLDCGDNVIVVNAKKVRLTGSKEKKKIYYKHTGYPGGLKETTFTEIINGKNPTNVIKKAVERMMSANALSKKQLSNLKIFGDEKHTLEAQKPELMDFASQNRKNKDFIMSKESTDKNLSSEPVSIEPKPSLDKLGRAYATGREEKRQSQEYGLNTELEKLAINGKPINEYFLRKIYSTILQDPLNKTENLDKVEIFSTVSGRSIRSGRSSKARY